VKEKRPRSIDPLRGILVALLALPGCGWHAGLTVPEGARSVGVEVVTRAPNVLERGLEPRLTQALSQAVSDLVGLPLESPSRADFVVRGEILNYRRRGGVRSIDNQLRESAVRIDVRATLVDRQTGKATKEVLEGLWSGYVLGDPAEERTAQNRAIRNLAETLVLELFQPGGQKEENPGVSAE